MDDIAELIERLRAAGRNVWQSVSATEQQVADLECAFGQQMPPRYRTFLQRWGAIGVLGSMYSGIINGKIEGSRGCAWTDTKRAREFCQLPPHYLVVQPDEDGYVCLDFSRTAPGGEHPVVYHMPFRNTPFNELAPNYAAWLRERLGAMIDEE
jgi:hypothetical protein